MNFLAITEYAQKNKEVTFSEIKEEFNLTESEINILIPFFRTMDVGIQNINKIEPACNKCPLIDECKKGFFKKCE
ncbi:hypothetical protein [Petrotoga sp. 9PWA.NaAc.5.4]|uniref:hypothetical protein n=1 Tax=Petrotoga sp. 9PWA.NaAc.5.4 TaxID=1434328 RepID=UPI000CC76730|nr:hypothetical protein [Petrotoga sp. 9PWA.NaAc.5.4]PNR96845.1 hypothetical protein X924_02260 [Petrotoga sp. 9PWA.NaAc.5.4]